MSPIIRHLLTASRQSSEAVKAKYSFNIAIQAGLTLLAFIGWVILKNYFLRISTPFLTGTSAEISGQVFGSLPYLLVFTHFHGPTCLV